MRPGIGASGRADAAVDVRSYVQRAAETGDTAEIIEAPKHPYVQELINSIPVPDPKDKWDTAIRLPSEESMRTKEAAGCRFYLRCPQRMDRCLKTQPALIPIDGDRSVACFLYEK